ncbi:hypothetical protein TrLO_g9808 [Triparma laevis f. longispina]|uniref:Aspartokinase n=1 Tax=Triparma laevis f. longispina TaxID=1714387 RepID=A0A9W7FQ85_9STRA|nr:hypothetical protein TrLO_g9808 [Triparma laevis f. longispina]
MKLRLIHTLLLALLANTNAFTPHSALLKVSSSLLATPKDDLSDPSASESLSNYRASLPLTRSDSSIQQKRTVMKFGGSSLADAGRIDHVAQLIKSQIALGNRPAAVVCSAMGKTTNNLLNAGDFALEGRVNVDALRTLHLQTIEEFQLGEHLKNEINALLDELENMLSGVKLLQELSPRSLDMLVSFGERMSVRMMAARLNQIGVPAEAYDSWNIGMLTDSNFGDATVLPSAPETIRKIFADKIDPGTVAIVTGFIAHDPNGKITTLGRGGSDLTATTIGAACELDEIQVWKDVDGIMSCDPRMVPGAVPISSVSFEEAAELAYFGAKVLHPIAMMPAMRKRIPVRVKNSYNPEHPGTVIKNREEGRLVTAITCKRDVQLIDISSTRMLGAYGFLSTVFSAFEKSKLSVDVLASSEVSVSLTLDKKHSVYSGHQLCDDLREVADVKVKNNKAIITLIADVSRTSEVLATVFQVFMRQGIEVEMLSQGASKVNISFIVKDDELVDAITFLHACFFEDNCLIEMPCPSPEEEYAREFTP